MRDRKFAGRVRRLMRSLRLWTFRLSLPALFISCGDDGSNVSVPEYADVSSDRRAADAPEAGPDGNDSGAAGDVGSEGSRFDADAGQTDAELEADARGVCGDGVVNVGEACDDGFRDECAACNPDCSGPGDGRPHASCTCVPAADAGLAIDAGADASVGVGEDFSAGMVAWPGHVLWEGRRALCG